MNMKIQQLMSVALLLGMVGCSIEPEPKSQPGTTQVVSAIMTRPSNDSAVVPGVKIAVGQAQAPTRSGAAPARSTVAAPPAVATPQAAPTFATAAQAASASLETLANVVALDPSTKRGFASRTEVASSALAEGLPVQFVRLDSLAAFGAGKDTTTLAFDKQEVMYPINVGGAVRSSVTVQKGKDGTWQAVKFGYASLARSSQAARVGATSKRSVDAGSMSLIEIPAVHAYLLSHREKGVQMVTPVWDIPGTSYTAGVTQPAAEVFAALQPIAAKTDPGPPSQR